MGFKHVCIDKTYTWYYVTGTGWTTISIRFITMEACDRTCERGWTNYILCICVTVKIQFEINFSWHYASLSITKYHHSFIIMIYIS